MIHDQDVKSLSFFKTLPDSLVERLIQDAKIVQFHKDDYILRENELGNEFYIILSGQVGIVNAIPHHQKEYLIQTLLPGASFGEMLLFNDGRRSADTIALAEVNLLKIDLGSVDKISNTCPELYSILLRHCGKIISDRIKISNMKIIHFLETINIKNQERVKAGNLFSYIILFMCLYTLFLKMINGSMGYFNDFYMVAFLFVFVIMPSFVLIKLNHYNARDFGLSLKNGLRHAAEAVFFTVPIILSIILIKWMFIHFNGHTLFDGVFISSEYKIKLKAKLSFLVFYMISCPFQEFVVRGVLQGFLEKMIVGAHSVSKAIVLSNIVFSTIHYYLSVKYGLMVFLPSLAWGYLYARQRTIVGSTISHLLTGVFAIYFMGVDGLIS